MEGFYRITSCITILGILFATFSSSVSLKLESDGGYELVIAVEDGSTIPAEQQHKYVQNVKGSLQVFSTQLWRATKKQFFIKSVEFVLPNDWTLDGVTEIAASKTYQTADIRVSKKVTFPHAENPNLCGLPGKFVELPLPFFDNANSNDFGPIWKTLMVLFARYRYGVWEEHGYVGDEKFPYFHKNYLSRQWEVTGCSNVPIVGSFLNAVDKEECTIDWASPAVNESCRFVPDRVQNQATTSLMHFHWMDSVVDFCDSTTHNRFAENKQNIFCNHKSIMEVIRESPDYKTVTSPSASVPVLSFKTVKQSAKPLFYVLLDKGMIQGSYEIARLLPQALANFFRRTENTDIIASIGSYPSGQSNAYVKEEVQWSQVGQNLDAFLQLVGDLRIDGPLERDFSRAILEVAEKLGEINHPHGAIMLVVKYGADLNNSLNWAPESEVILALNAHKIMLHTIELGIISEGSNSRSHLAPVARATTGIYTTLTNIGEASTGINNVLTYVQRTINSADYTGFLPNERTIVKNSVSSSSPLHVKVPSGSVSNLEVYYSSTVKLEQANFTISLDGAAVTYRFYRTVDWNSVEGSTKFTYRFLFTNLAGKKDISFAVNCTSCGGSVVARVEVMDDPTSENVNVEVLTSGNLIDLALHQPLTIFAKITKAGLPVGNLSASATISNGVSSVIIELHDDGNAPDALKNDGIFSSYYAPEQNGSYKISVTVEKIPTSFSKLVKNNQIQESSLARLLPIDQDQSAGCDGDCVMEQVEDNFMQTIDVPAQTQFFNAESFQPKPEKSIIIYIPASRLLIWNSPRVQGRNVGVTAYDMRYASTKEELLNNFESCQVVDGSALYTPHNPGSIESYRIPAIPITTTYYAIRAIYNNRTSDISNIKGFETEAMQTESPGTESPITETSGTGSPVTETPGTGSPPPTGSPTDSTSDTPITGVTNQSPNPSSSEDPQTTPNFSVVNKPVGITSIFIIVIAVISCQQP